MNKEDKMREKLKELKSPFYKNSRRNRNDQHKALNEALNDFEERELDRFVE